MGKGDQKTRRGKLFKGSYGVRRKRKKLAGYAAVEQAKPGNAGSSPEATTGKQTKKPSTVRKTTKPKNKTETSAAEEKKSG